MWLGSSYQDCVRGHANYLFTATKHLTETTQGGRTYFVSQCGWSIKASKANLPWVGRAGNQDVLHVSRPESRKGLTIGRDRLYLLKSTLDCQLDCWNQLWVVCETISRKMTEVGRTLLVAAQKERRKPSRACILAKTLLVSCLSCCHFGHYHHILLSQDPVSFAVH